MSAIRKLIQEVKQTPFKSNVRGVPDHHTVAAAEAELKEIKSWLEFFVSDAVGGYSENKALLELLKKLEEK